MTPEDRIAQLEADVAFLKKQIAQMEYELEALQGKFSDWEDRQRRKEVEQL
jgi:hypothetical protein